MKNSLDPILYPLLLSNKNKNETINETAFILAT